MSHIHAASSSAEKRRGSKLFALRPRDQAVVAAAALLGLAAIGWHWRQAGELVNVEAHRLGGSAFQVDVNQAAWPELAQLPGIGETLAHRIVESRQREGPFRSHEDLRRVHGIGPKKLDAARPFLAPIETP